MATYGALFIEEFSLAQNTFYQIKKKLLNFEE